MTALLITALVLTSPGYDLSWKGGMSCVDGDCTLPGDILSFDCNTCPCLIYQESETTDSNGCGITEHAGHAFGTSKDGGDFILCGGDASHSIATTAAIAAGDTVTTWIDGTALTVLTEGVDFDCSGTDDTCAASLCAAIDAQPGVSCSGTTSPIYPQVDADKCAMMFAFADGAADGVVGVDTTGAPGRIVTNAGTAAHPAITLWDDDSGIYYDTDVSSFAISINGVRRLSFDPGWASFTGGYYATGSITSGASQYIGPYGRARLYSSSTSSIQFRNASNDAYADISAAQISAAGSIISLADKGAETTQILNVASVTFDANPGNASKTTSGLCPANSIVYGVTYRVPTAATNCASVEIGDGADIDMFGTAQAIAQGTTGDISDYTDQTTRVNVYTASGFEATVTANGGNCFDGVWRFTCHYAQLTADTTN